jgi:hypothetical protein
MLALAIGAVLVIAAGCDPHAHRFQLTYQRLSVMQRCCDADAPLLKQQDQIRNQVILRDAISSTPGVDLTSASDRNSHRRQASMAEAIDHRAAHTRGINHQAACIAEWSTAKHRCHRPRNDGVRRSERRTVQGADVIVRRNPSSLLRLNGGRDALRNR